MNKFIILISFSILLLFQASCSSDTSTEKEPKLPEREQLYKEVMEIHDAVMPKMSEINRVKRNLDDQIEADSLIDDNLKSEVSTMLLELTAAEESMMDWMKGFKVPKKNQADELVIVYLNEEKLKISRVSELMLISLANGTKLLNQLENDKKEN